MADNTFNFDLDAPAVPTTTLDPTPAEEEKAAPAQQEAAAPEQPQVNDPGRTGHGGSVC